MLVYVESKAFPHRTFVVRAQHFDTIARVRAQILHILFELGREDHQFRLRFRGEYLRDAYTIDDYGIVENAVLKMLPIGRSAEVLPDFASETSQDVADVGILPDIKLALQKEVTIFNQREELLFHFKGLLFLHFMVGCLCFLTTFWYAGIYTLFLWLMATFYCPTFTRSGGFIGGHSIYKERFCILYGVGALVCLGAALYFEVVEWTVIVNHGCKDWEFVDDCSHSKVFTAIFFGFVAMLLLLSACMVFVLLWNIKIKCGDYVEKYLVQSRDIEDIMKAARSGRAKEKRVAAFELATMAATGDDNKFRIVAEGGLEVLIKLALSKDDTSQEHAVEAIAELLTVPAIQDNFVEMGGIRTLTALLHSKSDRLVYQVAMAISYIVADSEENKCRVVREHGLDDLAHAAKSSNLTNQRVVAGIYLELAFNSEVRSQMASLNTPAQALIGLCRSSDPDSKRYALQTLELLAIESPEMICAQEELLQLLLELPSQTYDSKVLALAGRILLYLAENRETCEALLDQPKCKDALMKYARTRDSILQKVVVKVIFCMLEVRELRYRVSHLELNEPLKYVRDHAADRECWDMADQAIQFLNSEEDQDNHDAFTRLPPLTTMEKMDKMDANEKAEYLRKEMGSQASLGSRTSHRSGPSSSSDDMKKEFD